MPPNPIRIPNQIPDKTSGAIDVDRAIKINALTPEQQAALKRVEEAAQDIRKKYHNDFLFDIRPK